MSHLLIGSSNVYKYYRSATFSKYPEYTMIRFVSVNLPEKINRLLFTQIINLIVVRDIVIIRAGALYGKILRFYIFFVWVDIGL
jgi:hypothetical protein